MLVLAMTMDRSQFYREPKTIYTIPAELPVDRTFRFFLPSKLEMYVLNPFYLAIASFRSLNIVGHFK
jgi:hypothetical protein